VALSTTAVLLAVGVASGEPPVVADPSDLVCESGTYMRTTPILGMVDSTAGGTELEPEAQTANFATNKDLVGSEIAADDTAVDEVEPEEGDRQVNITDESSGDVLATVTFEDSEQGSILESVVTCGAN
jgi:hypothetical protein